MKLIDKNTGLVVEIIMHTVDAEKIPSQEDISADILQGLRMARMMKANGLLMM